ncbi:peroxisomal targeting signal 2 receptor [Cryptotrichosporon argae]
MTLRLRTPAYAHHSLKFSPFFEDRVAIASGANFGLVGNGRLHVLRIASGGLQIEREYDTQDCVYDIAWNEAHENQILAACGNGALKLFDITLTGLPVRAWHEHTAEVMSADWSNVDKSLFATGSWDGTVKIWSPQRATSLSTFTHGGQIFTTAFSPHSPTVLSVGQDGHLRIWDLRAPVPSAAPGGLNNSAPSTPVLDLQVGTDEVLGADWNKYEPGLVATAGKDRAIGIWDLRMPKAARELRGHTLAVRRVLWSPHHRDVLASAGYDMTCRIWSMTQGPLAEHPDHTEFTIALGWALFDEGVVGSAAWDQEVHVWRVGKGRVT